MSLPAFKPPKPSWIQRNTHKIIMSLGIFFIGIAAIIFIKESLFFANSQTSIGRVVGYEVSNYKSLSVPLIQFSTPDGVTHLYKHTEGSNPPMFRKGENVKVYYNPNNFNDISLGYSFILIGIMLFFGIVFFVIGLGIKTK